MKAVFLVVLFLFGVSLAQVLNSTPPGQSRLYTIDDFLSGDNFAQVFYQSGQPLPQTAFDIYTNASNLDNLGLLGSERDLFLEIDDSLANTQTSSQIVFDNVLDIGYWSASTPIGASGFSFLQYDGRDNSVNLAPSGLGGVDLTFSGVATFLYVNIANDVSTEYDFQVTSTSGTTCTFTLQIAGTDGNSPRIDYYIPYSLFTPSTCFSSVGSIQVALQQFEQVDSQLYLFAIFGSVPSGTPTRTPAPPTQSPTPSQTTAPSQSSTPSGSPTPSSTPSQVLSWYTFDDDDEGVSPCGDELPRRTYFLDNDLVIYYYFYGNGDDNDVNKFYSDSSAGVLSLSAVLVSAIALLAF